MGARIRLVAESDAPSILRIYEPFCRADSSISFEVVPPSLEEIRERIRKISSRYPWLVWEQDGQVAGYVYASTHRERAAYAWGADVTVYIDPGFQRSGMGRKLYTALFELLKLQNVCVLYAGITQPNPGSVSLHEKMGFVRAAYFHGEGFKGGMWRDVGWFEKVLQRPSVPEPVIPFPALQHDPRVSKILNEIPA